MEVQSQMNTPAVTGVTARPPATTVSKLKRDALVLENSRALEAALAQTPESRLEEVARARHLIGQVRWPPDEMIRRIAELLGIHIESPSE
jgi:hypothetical protein